MATLTAISNLHKKTIAIAPNSDAGNNEIFESLKDFSQKFDFIQMYRNLPREAFLGLLKYSGVLVGNSSSGVIEASYFDIPVVNIGIRQKDRERGDNVIDVPRVSEKIIQKAVKTALTSKKKKFTAQKIYGNGNSGKFIAKKLSSIKITKKLIQKQIHY